MVPASLLVLLALVTFTLLSYRGAVAEQVEQRQREALGLARAAATELSAPGPVSPRLADLRRYSAVEGAYLATPAGRLVASSGAELGGPFLAPWQGTGEGPAVAVADGLVAGPDSRTGARVVAVVPSRVDGEVHWLRVEVPVPALAAQRRGLGVLTWVVCLAGVGVVLLLILFLRQLLAPYDDLVARARELSGELADPEAEGGAGENDVELLVRTFEQGVAALAAGRERGGGSGGDDSEAPSDGDLAALQRTLAASLESGLLLLDEAGEVVALNAAGASLLQVERPAAGAPLEVSLAAHPDLVALLRDAVSQGRAVQRRELTLHRPPVAGTIAEKRDTRQAGDGGVGEAVAERPGIHLGLSVHPLRREGGDGGLDEIRGYLVLFADLTEVRRRGEEARLEESLVRLGELAAGVAHELRNSLATMRGYLTLLERSPEESPGAYLAEVGREADHLQRVLEDFLAFARPGSVRLEEVSLRALAERAAIDPALDGAAVEVVAETALGTETGAPTLNGDPQMLERAVRNLLGNAREAQRAAGTGDPLTVRVRRLPGGGEVELAVEDRGDGVAPDLEGRLFTPFVTGRPGGVGLGLALSHRIVSLHGGTLRLDPRPGGGTVARMRFPVAGLQGGVNEAEAPARGA